MKRTRDTQTAYILLDKGLVWDKPGAGMSHSTSELTLYQLGDFFSNSVLFSSVVLKTYNILSEIAYLVSTVDTDGQVL